MIKLKILMNAVKEVESMGYRQLYCAERNIGKNDEKEYKTYAVSDGMSDQDVEEIEKLCTEFNAEYRKYLEKTGKSFESGNVFYFSYVLKSGSYCFTAAKSVFNSDSDCSLVLCCTYIADKEGFPFYTINLAGSEAFVFSEPLEGEFENRRKLPRLQDLKVNNSINFESVAGYTRFITGNNLRKIISGAVSGKLGGTRLIISDTNDNLIYWIAVIQYSFTVKLANSITYATFSPVLDDGRFAVNCLPEAALGNDYLEKAGESISYFDFINSRFINTEYEMKFSRLMDLGYSAAEETLKGFHNFVNKIGYADLDEDMDSCYTLYSYISVGIGNFSHEDIAQAVAFAQKHKSVEGYEFLFNSIVGILGKIAEESDIDFSEMTADFLLEIAKETKNPIIYDNAFSYIYIAMDNMILKSDGSNGDKIIEFYESYEKKIQERKEYFVRYPINPRRIKYIIQRLSSGAKPEHAEFYLRLIIESFIKNNFSWNRAIAIDEFKNFLETCFNFLIFLKWDFSSIFSAAVQNPVFLSDMADFLYSMMIKNENFYDNIYKASSEFYNSSSTESKIELMKNLIIKEHGEDILFGIFTYSMENLENTNEFYNRWIELAVNNIFEFAKKYYSAMAEAYAGTIAEEERTEECYKILKIMRDNEFSVEDRVLSLIIKGFESCLPLINISKEYEEIIPYEVKMKKTKNIKTNPDICAMIEIRKWLDDRKGTRDVMFGAAEILSSRIEFDGVDRVQYREYLCQVLKELFNYVDSMEDHRYMLGYFAAEEYIEDLNTIYMKCLKEYCISNEKNSIHAAESFMIYYIYYIFPGNYDENEKRLYDILRKGMIDIIAALDDGKVQELKNAVIIEFNDMRLSTPKELNVMISEAVKSRSSSIFGKLFGMFKK